MLSKELGTTGVKIPEIGLGTWHYHAGPEPLRRGLDAGALFIDTAESYETESVVADAIEGRRDQVFLATKVSPANFRRGEVLKAADRSLRQLRVSCLDLYQLHEPNDAIPIAETLGAMEELVDAGKVRFVGVSNFSLAQLQQAQKAMRRHKIVANQVRYNLIDRTITDGLLAYCQAQGITVIAYSPLARGFQHIADSDPQGVLARLVAATGRTAAQIALNWCVTQPGVVAIPKGNSVEHVLENCGGSDWRLTPEQVQELDRAIAFRRRSRLESFVRRHLPRSAITAMQYLLKHSPRALRRKVY